MKSKNEAFETLQTLAKDIEKEMRQSKKWSDDILRMEDKANNYIILSVYYSHPENLSDDKNSLAIKYAELARKCKNDICRDSNFKNLFSIAIKSEVIYSAVLNKINPARYDEEFPRGNLGLKDAWLKFSVANGDSELERKYCGRQIMLRLAEKPRDADLVEIISHLVETESNLTPKEIGVFVKLRDELTKKFIEINDEFDQYEKALNSDCAFYQVLSSELASHKSSFWFSKKNNETSCLEKIENKKQSLVPREKLTRLPLDSISAGAIKKQIKGGGDERGVKDIERDQEFGRKPKWN